MNNLVLVEVVETNEDLDGKSLYQVKRKALEVVHFDEFIEVDRKHFESDTEMLSEQELVMSSDYVFLVLGVMFVQVLYQSGLHQSLLIQPLLVFKNLEGYVALLLVIVASKNHAK